MKKILLFILMVSLFSCSSIKKAAVSSVADMMSGSGGGSIFTSDDDPQLIAEAMPFALKVYEVLLESNPEDQALLAATGKNFILYAGGFVQLPASMLPDEQYLEKQKANDRASRLFRRGRGYLERSLELKYPGFMDGLAGDNMDQSLNLITKEDFEVVYWMSLAWVGEYSCDPFNMELGVDIYQPVALLYKLLEIDETYGEGSLHSIILQIQASMPESMIANVASNSAASGNFIEEYYSSRQIEDSPAARSRYHFEQALGLGAGNNPSLYISLASSISVKEQNSEEFINLLETALAIDPDELMDQRLEILIYQEKAQWLLDHIEDYFLI